MRTSFPSWLSGRTPVLNGNSNWRSLTRVYTIDILYLLDSGSSRASGQGSPVLEGVNAKAVRKRDPRDRSCCASNDSHKPAMGQQPQTYRAPRLPGTQNPDMNGIWEVLNTANWDLEPHAAGPSPFPAILGAIAAEPAGAGVVEGGKIPYQPWAEARRKENLEEPAGPAQRPCKQ